MWNWNQKEPKYIEKLEICIGGHIQNKKGNIHIYIQGNIHKIFGSLKSESS